jgi:hypothetical protein
MTKCQNVEMQRARVAPTLTRDAAYHAPRCYVSCSPLSHCRIAFQFVFIPPDISVYTKLGGKRNLRQGRSFGAVLNQLLASLTCLLSTFAHVLFAVHHLTPFHLHALPFAPNLHTANFHAQFRNSIMLPKQLTRTCVSVQQDTDLEIRYTKNML